MLTVLVIAEDRKENAPYRAATLSSPGSHTNTQLSDVIVGADRMIERYASPVVVPSMQEWHNQPIQGDQVSAIR